MGEIKTVQESKVYCDECIFLENRPTLAETSFGSGKYVQTGTRFHCKKSDKWYPIGTTRKEVGFNFCLQGEKKENGNEKIFRKN